MLSGRKLRWGAAGLVLEQLTRTRALGRASLAKQLCDVSHFLRVFRVHLRFGELSRSPLKLLHLQLADGVVECEWLARPSDPWDRDLPPRVGAHNASIHALEDAIAMREYVLCLMPDVDTAAFRVYRLSAQPQIELIIEGRLTRQDDVPQTIQSLAMKAKLLGFQFVLDGDVLASLGSQCAVTV